MSEAAEQVQQTLAEYERLAIGTGATVRIDPPEFSAEGEAWSPLWLAVESPTAARVTVYRGDVPTTVYVSWEESFPAVDEWRELWMLKPMKLFGAYTVRAALRRAFRDVIGDRREPDEVNRPVVDDRPAAGWDLPARDWLAEVKAADAAKLNGLYDEAREAGALVKVEGLQQAFTDRMLELSAAPKPKPAPRPAVTDKPAGQGQRRRRGKRSS